MRIRGQAGVPVQFVECSPDEAVSATDDGADELLDEGWPPEAVALLTTHRIHPVQVERQDAYWATYWQNDDAFYGHVLGFKGLERSAVVFAVNGFRNEARAGDCLRGPVTCARPSGGLR